MSMESVPDAGHWPVNPQEDVPIDEGRIWIDGCFDFSHHGHAGAMLQARRLGKELYVGVHSDQAILDNKGPPVMNLDERVAAVRACRWATTAIPLAPYVTSIPWIDHYGCKYVVHGDDITSDGSGEDCYRFVKEVKRFWVVKRTPGISTTDLVGRMLLCTKTHFIPSLAPLLEGTDGPGDAEQRKTTSLEMTRTLKDYCSDTTGHNTGLSVFGCDHDLQMKTFIQGSWKPQSSQRVVYIDGGFDLFSAGHLNFLRRVLDKDMGRHNETSKGALDHDGTTTEFNKNFSFIVVGIHSDAVVNKYKGLNYPIMNLYERILCVLQCGHVSSVIFDAPYSPSRKFLESMPFGRVDAIYHGATKFMPSEEDPYFEAKEMGIFEELEPHGWENLNAELIMSRIVEQRVSFEARQRQKAAKSEVERLEKERQAKGA